MQIDTAEGVVMDTVIYEVKDRIAYITINRPHAYNACDVATYIRLSEIWRDFRDNDDAWVAILTGAGEKAFCAGSDIKQNYAAAPAPVVAEAFAANPQADIMRGLEVWKPIIAAINGHCNGGGLEMALGCDVRLAAEHAQFGLGEIKLGLIPGGGGTQRLPRTIPLCHALWMIYTGERIDAREAYRLGLVNRVVPLAELIPTAEAMARRILEAGPLAVRAAKQAAIAGLSMPLAEGLRLEAHLVQMLFATADFTEGAQAFAEKRHPKWQAR